MEVEPMMLNETMNAALACITCGRQYPRDEVRYRCDCGETLEIAYAPADPERQTGTPARFDARLALRQGAFASGVWRFREWLPEFADREIVCKPEGDTNLYAAGAEAGGGPGRIGAYAGVDTLWLKHEGENPTGSFKDRGMTVGVSQARRLGARAVACASTGNTSASLAAYAAQADTPCFVFIPAGKVAAGKLAQRSPTARSRCRSRRFRRGDAAGARRRATASASTSQLDQPVPHRGAEDDRLGAAAGARLERARLDRRPRREPRQHERLRQGAARGAGAGWIVAHAAPRRDPGQRRESVLPQLSRTGFAQPPSPCGPRRSPARSASAIRSARTAPCA